MFTTAPGDKLWSSSQILFFFSGSVKSYIYLTTNSMVCRASSKGSGFIINYLEF